MNPLTLTVDTIIKPTFSIWKLKIKDLCMQSIQIFSAPVEPAGFCSSQPSVQVRGNLFNELPTPQQLHDQEKYKDCLKQQVWTLLPLNSAICAFGLPSHFVITFGINRSKKRGERRQKRESGKSSRKRKKRGGWPNSELGSKGSTRKSKSGSVRKKKRFLVLHSYHVNPKNGLPRGRCIHFEALVLTQI